jgi:hypothetical protein
VSNAKHTPGPWFLDGIAILTASKPHAEICLMGEPATWAGAIPTMCPNSDANASLIVAAPDLLEACIRLLASQTLSNPDPDNDADVIYARAAIAKATGSAT